MPSLATLHPLPEYLRATRWTDHEAPEIRALVEARGWRALGPVEAARRAFELVRDEIPHSWDIRSHVVTRTATECLQHREGLCYAKAMLLAALLRAMEIPAGLAYQRLTFGDTPDTGYSTHGLTTVYLEPLGKWIRLDARGNKPGVDAQFSVDERKESLAFAVRPEMGEIDYLVNLPEPPASVTRALDAHDDLHALIEALPDGI
jgi:transglutaminase-like putative cysteine protease